MILDVKAYLETKTTLPVYAEDEPEYVSGSFFVVKSTVNGEYLSEYQDVPIEAYADSSANAYSLICNVKRWMIDFDSSKVSSVQLNTIYKDNDTVKKRHRYRGVWRVKLF